MKRHRFLIVVTTIAAISGDVNSDSNSGVLKYGNAAWVYDITNKLGNTRRYDPGYFSAEINKYNQSSGKEHKINIVYTYAGSLEMYCPGKGGERCGIDHLMVGYPPGEADTRLQKTNTIETIEAYQNKIDPGLLNGKLWVVPVIDGVVNEKYSGSMRGFNQLNRTLAERYADKVARKLCSDPRVPGVQFDIEPFDVQSKSGQYHFYRRIAENFSGTVRATKDGPAVQCKNKDFPQGRFFSVFTSSNHLNPSYPGGKNISDIMNHRGNGYVIAALYDLGSGQPGQSLSVAEYSERAHRHASQMKEWSEQLQVPYRFGIPAAATVHEHEICRGARCQAGGRTKARSQEGYVEASLEAIEDSGARSSSYFLGVAVWAWTRGIRYQDIEFEPRTPPSGVLKRLQNSL